VVARIARETGALVLAVATLPFECEGTRRRRQAHAGLDQLKEAADAVICLPNERVLQLIDENTSVIDTFKIGNELLGRAVRGIWRLLRRNGIINVDFADVCSVVRGSHAESCFADVEARGEHRSREVVEKLMNSPLLEGGAALTGAESILVSLVGGSDLSMADVNRVMSQINRACENAQIVMGAAVDEGFKDRLAVTVIATRGAASGPETVRQTATDTSGERAARSDAVATSEGGTGLDDQLLSAARTRRPSSRFIPPPPSLTAQQKEQVLAQQTGAKAYRRPRTKMRQGVLPLEIVSKGRFEKSEPTLYQGEDLDVPTYIRRGVPLN
jgi:cell division protein FtsZ